VVFLLILIIATAVLIAWLLVEFARLVLADLRFGRVPEGSLQVAAPDPPVNSPPASPQRAGQSPPDPGNSERVLYDEADVERAIRDRLYGGHRRRST
jgi:hypothetical protein